MDVARRRRGTSLVAVVLRLIAILSWALTLALVLWAISAEASQRDVAFWAFAVTGATLGLVALVGAAGCFVEVDGDVVRDAVAWITIRRIPRADVASVRIDAGIWRRLMVDTTDGHTVPLLGASPPQFADRLGPDGERRDRELLAWLSGSSS